MNGLAIDRQAITETCGHCGREYQVTRGSVYREGEPFALFIAGMHGCRGERVVALTIALSQGPKATPLALTLQILPTETEYQMRIVEPSLSPWRDQAYLGRMLSRPEALAGQLKPTFFEIADAVIAMNPELNSYLGGSPDPAAPGG
jgi:hypothetical protein